MDSSDRATPSDATPNANGEGDGTTTPHNHNRALHWVQTALSAGGIIAAITIWALGGPPLIAAAVATAAAGGVGWQITVNVRQ
ncbi:hypothetical protein [Streptomyces mirabilis]|uniref:hypothetical protein n=1 Tax=Streptomyces mirabilis TaxID=68239 RepID=UPI0036971E79